jgi:hypothetical protein
MVAQSEGSSIAADKIKKKFGRNVHSSYSMLGRLTGGLEDIPGIRLFCFDDLCNDDKNEQQLPKLKEKLKESYGYFLRNWHWKKLTPHPFLTKDDKTIILEHDKSNRIKVTLHRNEEDDEKKVQMNIRFIPNKDIKYSDEIKSLIRLANLPSSNFPKESPLRKWLKSNYISLDIPLIPKRKDGRLYFRTLSRESYYTEKTERACLRLTLNEEGERLVKSNQKKLYSLTHRNSNSLGYEQKQERNLIIMDKLKRKISKIRNSMQYNNLSVTINGLLDYALKECNHKEFNKSISNLAECDEYDEIIREGYEYDDLGFPELKIRIPASSYHFKYKIKGYLPFLSHYDSLEKALPPKFVLSLLRCIASEVKRYSLDMMPQGLRYIVTRMFYNEIKSWYISMGSARYNNITNAIGNNNEDKTGIDSYLSELGVYIEHVEEMDTIEQENAKTYLLIQKRFRELYNDICTTIENNKNEEIITIYEHLNKVRLPWSHVSEALKSIEKGYGNKYILINTCLVTKSKAKKLRSLLKEDPPHDEACQSLIRNGVPKPCIAVNLDLEDFLQKLGFCTKAEKLNVELKPGLKQYNVKIVKLKVKGRFQTG